MVFVTKCFAFSEFSLKPRRGQLTPADHLPADTHASPWYVKRGKSLLQHLTEVTKMGLGYVKKPVSGWRRVFMFV
jgi:hypothetical protein